MPIPSFNADGLLPIGIHDCTLLDIKERFGAFQGSDRRPKLFARLEVMAAAMRQSGLFAVLVIDGSFVSDKAAPNDIDIIAVLRPNQNLESDLPMSEYALLSRTLLRRRFGFDVIVAEQDSSLYRTYVDFFSRLREAPELRKGLLRLAL